MLTIPLARLQREGSLEISAAISPSDPSWEGTEFRFATPLSVSGQAQWLPDGEVLVRLELRGQRALECRRCLEPVATRVQEKLELFFAPMDEADSEDDEQRLIPDGVGQLDLAEALREEMILALSPLALCRPDCKGLCPYCGQNLNESNCQCTTEEPDPRWDALRALKKE